MRFLADENFDGRVVNSLRRKMPTIDLQTVVEAGLSGIDDHSLLEWAASQNLVVLTHDVNTMAGFAYDRVDQGLPMPGVIEVPNYLSIQLVVDHLLLIEVASSPGEWEGKVIYIPL